MNTTAMWIIGIIISVIGWFVFSTVNKQKNRIDIKAKDSVINTGDITGGDKIAENSRKNKK